MAYKKLTKLEILEETLEFYTADPKRRSMDADSNCMYNGADGTHCAVGRCLMTKYHKLGNKLEKNDWGVDALYEKYQFGSIDPMLSPRYRGHEIDFWTELQELHDTSYHWDENGITESGKRWFDKVKGRIEANISHD